MKNLLYLLPFVLLLVLAGVSKAATPAERVKPGKAAEDHPFSSVSVSLGLGVRGAEMVTSMALATTLWKNGELELGFSSGKYGFSGLALFRHNFAWRRMLFGVHAGVQKGTYVYGRTNESSWDAAADTVVSGYEGVAIGRIGLHAGLSLPRDFGIRLVVSQGHLLSKADPVEFSGSGEEPESLDRKPIFGGLELFFQF